MSTLVRKRDGRSQPAILRCDCGNEVALSRDANRCECGTFYNMCGQRLAPPSQWGEETGERFGSRGEYLGGGEE